MVPGALRRAAGFDRDVLLLRVSDSGLAIELRSGDRGRELASVKWGDADRADPTAVLQELLAGIEPRGFRVVLSFDSELAVRRTLHIPRAAETELTAVLAFEIERHTPFRADEVYFTPSVDRGTNGDKSMSVDLVIVPRRIVDPLNLALRRLGFGPHAVIVMEAFGPFDEAVSRLPVDGADEPRKTGGTALKLVATLILVLALAAVTTPLIRLKSVAGDATATVRQAKIKADAVVALRDEVDRLIRGAQTVASARKEAPSPLAILQALSQSLPDGTWIVQFNLTEGTVFLEGRTGSSAALVGILEASPMFESVTYMAPVTRDPAGGSERFSFSFKIAKG